MEPRSQINVGNRIHSFSTRGHESSSRGGSFPTLGGAILERLNEGIGSDDSRGEPEERRSSRIRSIRKPSSLLIPGSREISVGMRRNGAPHSWPARALSRYNRGQRIQRPGGSQNGAQTRGPTSFQLARCFLEARNRCVHCSGNVQADGIAGNARHVVQRRNGKEGLRTTVCTIQRFKLQRRNRK